MGSDPYFHAYLHGSWGVDEKGYLWERLAIKWFVS
jgi:hypothetical protein